MRGGGELKGALVYHTEEKRVEEKQKECICPLFVLDGRLS